MADFSWLLISAAFVFLMQAGFLCLETGRIRSKNSINVAAKNITDFVLSSIVFWLFGFAIMFGSGSTGWFGTTEFFFGDTQNAHQIAFFLFQMMFCGTATTLMSGAVAERMTFSGYLAIALILSMFIYPVAGHWAWASAYGAGGEGWLERLGFVDFAGSTVVHSVGGWVSLAAIVIIGPRFGRFDKGVNMPVGNNLPMSVLGALLIWFGWFGFNGGSTLEMNDQVPKILLNTCLAAAWAGFAAATLQYRVDKYVDVSTGVNGVIAGLVAITASCHAVSPLASMLIGIVAGVVLFYGELLMEKLKLDDALGVVPAHLFAGIWGTLAVAIFGQLDVLGTGLSRVDQLLVQSVGIIAIGVYSLGLSYMLMNLVNRLLPLRVSEEDELVGLNVSEHRASTELIDLLSSIQRQQDVGDFSTAVPEEPFTEVGQIAHKYNQVIAQVNEEIVKRDMAIGNFQSSEKRKTAILDSSMDCILSIDLDGQIIEFNPSAERTFGCLKRQVVGKDFIKHFVLEQDLSDVYYSLKTMFSASKGLVLNRRNFLVLRRISGHEFPAEITITRTRFGTGTNNEFTLHIRDVTKQVKLQEKLKFLAYSDPLTGLYNRTYLMEKLVDAIREARVGRQVLAVLFLDLDKFKKINDTLGHRAGDALLCEVAKRLSEVTRESDVIARWGGDEFVLLFHGMDANQACAKANEILIAMRKPVTVDEKVINILTSIGIAISENGEPDADRVIQYADIAMYTAKQNGRDNLQLFEPEMVQLAKKNFYYEQAIKEALDTEQFSLVYQPKVRAKDGPVVGLEALIRWQHPVEGNIPPSTFIPLAEESNLIVRIDQWVVTHALKQLNHWISLGVQPVPLSVNVSGKNLVSNDLIPFIKAALKQYNISGSLLELEITEGVLLSDIDRCIEVMSELKALNVRISVDDFGTGYSSLNYLKKLPIDILKIDRSFVEECDVIEEDGQICATIINLAKNLELTTVAEGVETRSQFEFLEEHGCDLYQGFYFHRPYPPETIETMLRPAEFRVDPSYLD